MAEPDPLLAEPQQPQGQAPTKPKPLPSLDSVIGNGETITAERIVPKERPWFGSGDDFIPWKLVGRAIEQNVRDVQELPHLFEKGPSTLPPKMPSMETESAVGGFVQGAVNFALPFSAALKAAKIVTGSAKLIKAGEEVGTLTKLGEVFGATAAASFMTGQEGAALSTWLSTLPNETAQQIGGILATDMDDTQLEKRLKNVLEQLPIAGAAEGVLYGLKGAYHLLRGNKAAAAAAGESSEAALTKLGDQVRRDTAEVVNPAPEAPRATPVEPTAPEPKAAPAAPTEAPGATTEAKPAPEAPTTPPAEIPAPRLPENADERIFGIDRAKDVRARLDAEPSAMKRAEMLEAELKGGLNRRGWRSPKDAVQLSKDIEQANDRNYDNARVESFKEQKAADVGNFAELAGEELPQEDARLFAMQQELTKDKPEQAKAVAKYASLARIYSGAAEGSARDTLKVARASLSDPNNVGLLAMALDQMSFHATIVNIARAIRSEFGRGLGSFGRLIAHFSKAERAKLRAKMMGGEAPSFIDTFADSALKDRSPSFGELVHDPAAFEAKITQYGGRERAFDLMKQMTALDDMKDFSPGQLAAAVADRVRVVKAPKLLEFPLEWFSSAILSAPKTVLNVADQQFTQGLFAKTFFHGIGASAHAAKAYLLRNPELAHAMAVEARTNFRAIAQVFMPSNFMPALRFSAKAFKQESPVLLGEGAGSAIEQTIGGPKLAYAPIREWFKENLPHTDPDGVFPRALYWAFTEKGANIGKFLRTPFRALTWVDELTKQLSTRAYIKASLYEKGLEKFPANTEAATAWADGEMQRLFKGGRLRTEKVIREQFGELGRQQESFGMVPNGSEWAEKQIAKEMTDDRWTRELVRYAEEQGQEAAGTLPVSGAAQKAIGALNEYVWPRFFVPFLRTAYSTTSSTLRPVNIPGYVEAAMKTKFFTKAPALEKVKFRLARDLVSGDPRRVSDVTGRIAMAGATAMTVAWLTDRLTPFGMPWITGAGPKSKGARNVLESAGWKANSVYIPGQGYAPYRTLPFLGEPASLWVSGIADLMLLGKYNAEDEDGKAQGAMDHLNWAAINLVKNLSWMQGVQNMVELATGEKSLGQVGQNMLGSMAVPNIIPSVGFGAESTLGLGEPTVREARNAVDEVMSRFPGLDANLPVLRDWMFQPVKKQTFIGPDVLSPFALSPTDDRIVGQEASRIGLGFLKPGVKREGIDLQALRYPNGETAYDKMLQYAGETKLGGLTLPDQLRKVISSDGYQKLTEKSVPGFPSPRKTIITRIREQYLDLGWMMVKRDLSQQVVTQKKAQLQAALDR